MFKNDFRQLNARIIIIKKIHRNEKTPNVV